MVYWKGCPRQLLRDCASNPDPKCSTPLPPNWAIFKLLTLLTYSLNTSFGKSFVTMNTYHGELGFHFTSPVQWKFRYLREFIRFVLAIFRVDCMAMVLSIFWTMKMKNHNYLSMVLLWQAPSPGITYARVKSETLKQYEHGKASQLAQKMPNPLPSYVKLREKTITHIHPSTTPSCLIQ